MIKKFIKKYFESFAYFYTNLRHRVFVVLGLSILIGVLDGLGLTMFLPLLQMINDSESVDSEELGKLQFLVDFLNSVGLELNLLTVLAFMMFFFVGKGIVQYIADVYKVNVQQNFITKLRLKNLRGLNNLSYKYFVMSDAGRIQNTLTGEIARVSTAYSAYLKALQYIVLVIVYMAFAFTLDAQFAVLVSIGGILTNFLYKNLYRKTKGASRKLTGDNNIFQSLIIQNVANFKYLKATGSLRRYEKKLSNSVKKIEGNNKKIGKLSAILTSAREPILVLVVVSVIYIQTSIMGSGLGPILMSLVFFYRALSYLMLMQTRYNMFLAVSGSLENIMLFEQEMRQNKEKTGSGKPDDSVKVLELSQVEFFYDQTPILRKIDLKVNSAETVAFVGESGSGKTTLVNILAGLLPVGKGNYLINAVNSNEWNINAFQKKIGYITQDSVIFNDSLYNNVTFWAERTEENVNRFAEAIRKAAINDFVQSLPEKEDTYLGNNGINLSGGQKQRISIARELFKEVEILILDEATSALDSETERAIQENIDALKGEYTILIVAHRIATIKNADRIVVMKNGEISHIGAFSELLEKSPYFKKLVELQEV
ncbi:antibiotic ABC transporter ATP-binding protein [Salinimicrobium marinum]|uniref:Antibiotic ABC transporter ATP-binding protein n=1 Tax=Salinimicrobium marinum TaxID=680283 RepID=A0A918VUE4_9FLAO|nr:ABC transporter ATP-binding protein [Salinimicrobium marinum]GHA30129.1 antibiotic ABC transporter ATP-binding protein [Salinimicrobium marinum]